MCTLCCVWSFVCVLGAIFHHASCACGLSEHGVTAVLSRVFRPPWCVWQYASVCVCVCVGVCVQVYTLMHPCSSHCSITFLCHASVRRHWTLDLWLTGVRRAPPHIYLNSVWQCRVHCLAFLDVSSNHTEFVSPSQSKHDVSVACIVELTWQAAAAVCNMRRSACRVTFAPDAP